MFKYAIVEFLEGIKREVDIVCMSWLVGDGSKTLWPNKDAFNKQKKAAEPGMDWKTYSVRIIDRAKDWTEARRMLAKSEYTSDVRSEVDDTGLQRKRKAKCAVQRISSDSEESVDSWSPLKHIEVPKTLMIQKNKFRRREVVSGRPNEVVSVRRREVVSGRRREVVSGRPNEVLSGRPNEVVSGRPNEVVSGRLNEVLSDRRNEVPQNSDWPNEALQNSDWPKDVTLSTNLVTQADFSAFQEVVFSKMEEIKEIGLQNNILLKRLICSNKTIVSTEDMPSGMPDLPLTSMSAVSDVETWLMVDENKQHLVNYLSTIGGKDVQEITRNVMSTLVSKSVAIQYNWAGRRGKLPFKEMKLKDVVFGAVLKGTSGREFSFMAVAAVIKNWLKSARYRVSQKSADYNETT